MILDDLREQKGEWEGKVLSLHADVSTLEQEVATAEVSYLSSLTEKTEAEDKASKIRAQIQKRMKDIQEECKKVEEEITQIDSEKAGIEEEIWRLNREYSERAELAMQEGGAIFFGEERKLGLQKSSSDGQGNLKEEGGAAESAKNRRKKAREQERTEANKKLVEVQTAVRKEQGIADQIQKRIEVLDKELKAKKKGNNNGGRVSVGGKNVGKKSAVLTEAERMLRRYEEREEGDTSSDWIFKKENQKKLFLIIVLAFIVKAAFTY